MTAPPLAPENEASNARLRELAGSHLDNVFGRNPMGRHLSYGAESDFPGVGQGWL